MAYLILAALAFAPTVFLIWRQRSSRLLATYFVACGTIIVGDYVAGAVLHLYTHHPGLMASSMAEDALGAVLADMIFSSGLAILICAFRPGWLSYLLGSGLVTAIEALFVRLGIFTHQGWQLWYTTLSFPIFFCAVCYYWRAVSQHGVSAGWRLVLARLGIITACLHLLAMHIVWAPPGILMNIHWLPLFRQNQALGIGLTGFGPVTLVWLWVLAGERHQRLMRGIISALIFIAADYARVKLGLWRFAPGWNPARHILLQSIALTVACSFDQLIQRWERRHQQAAAP